MGFQGCFAGVKLRQGVGKILAHVPNLTRIFLELMWGRRFLTIFYDCHPGEDDFTRIFFGADVGKTISYDFLEREGALTWFLLSICALIHCLGMATILWLRWKGTVAVPTEPSALRGYR